MRKQELIACLAAKTGLTQIIVRDVLVALGAQTTENLIVQKVVALPGIGKLVLAHRKASKARNMRTGVILDVPACHLVKLRPTAALRNLIK